MSLVFFLWSILLWRCRRDGFSAFERYESGPSPPDPHSLLPSLFLSFVWCYWAQQRSARSSASFTARKQIWRRTRAAATTPRFHLVPTPLGQPRGNLNRKQVKTAVAFENVNLFWKRHFLLHDCLDRPRRSAALFPTWLTSLWKHLTCPEKLTATCL